MRMATLGTLARKALPVVTFAARRVMRQKTPFQITFSLTNRCNFRCEYCHIPLQHREEMTTDEWISCFREFKDAGMGRASLIGGEPMVRRDVGQLIGALKDMGVHVAMNTNGWFVEDRIDEVAGLDLACITLDGPPEVNDAQRHPGSYDRAIGAIRAFRKRGIRVVTMTVITPSGAQHVDHVLEAARREGTLAFFQLEHDADCDVHLPIAPRMSDAAVAGVARRLLALKEAGAPVGNSRSILEAQIHDGRRIGGDCSECFAGEYYGYVLSDGTVAPCLLTQWQQQRGNGRALGFARAFHEMAPPSGPGCGCVPIHEVNRVLSFDVSVLRDALDLALASTPPAA
jgi:MoaA/NifB/PqqE/SkfB family radical SAM enzyme